MTKNEINQASKRIIKSGLQFNNLIDEPKKQIKQLEKGNTFYTVDKMKDWVIDYHKQVAKLSNVLKSSSLKNTSSQIHNFLYNYIQYEADNILQNLRSPANSWHNRVKGIDCKSYSIFASSILTNLGIKHYIRQIKQLGFNPDQFTHVYIVVPVNQITGNLRLGYYVIDGTIKETKEPFFTIKKDLFMNKLPHIGLNGTPRKKTKNTSAKKLCSSIIVKDGLKKDGTLKKGYKYIKGGKIVKSKTTKK